MFKLILDLCFPPLCQACNTVLSDNELVICTACRHHLPLAFPFGLDRELQPKVLQGIELQDVYSLFFFQKGGKVQQLLHHLKYKNQQKLVLCWGSGWVLKWRH